MRGERIEAVKNGLQVLVSKLALTSLRDVTENRDIPMNSMVELTAGKQLLLYREAGGRLVVVQRVNK